MESELPRYAQYNMPLSPDLVRAIETDEPDRDPTVALSREELRQTCRDVLHRRSDLIGQLSQYPHARLRVDDIESGEEHDNEVVMGGWKWICLTFSGLSTLLIMAFGFTIWFGSLHV